MWAGAALRPSPLCSYRNPQRPQPGLQRLYERPLVFQLAVLVFQLAPQRLKLDFQRSKQSF
ncbi:MAG: hypothetical protein QOJ16_2967 [Acidobacteriota bacterium]|jgi:hypothetical protein|nr:hypothetical protein [Acidobacteriota bacterium]